MLRDPQLLLAYREGSQEAYLTLYKKYSAPLRRFLQGGFSFQSQGRFCRFRGADSGMDVEAMVQETFARAFVATTRQNYDGVRPFQTYLFSIAKNLVLRECHYRDRNVSVDEFEDPAEDYSASKPDVGENFGDSPEKRASNKQLKEILHHFTLALTPEERDFFSYRFSKGLTQEATALRMGTTRARIKLLEKNIRGRFLEILRQHGYFVNYDPTPRWKRSFEQDAMNA